jgi:hypothetical protein
MWWRNTAQAWLTISTIEQVHMAGERGAVGQCSMIGIIRWGLIYQHGAELLVVKLVAFKQYDNGLLIRREEEELW